MKGATFGKIRNEIFNILLSDKDLLKAVVVETDNFLKDTPTKGQSKYLDSPPSVVRNFIYPYKRIFDTATEKKTFISMELSNFYKRGSSFRDGTVTFYILTPLELENTIYGLRYDYIGDRLEEIYSKTNIGDFNFQSRGDLDVGDRYIGHYVTFKVTEFHIY